MSGNETTTAPLTTGGIAGVSVGSVLGVILIIFIIICCCCFCTCKKLCSCFSRGKNVNPRPYNESTHVVGPPYNPPHVYNAPPTNNPRPAVVQRQPVTIIQKKPVEARPVNVPTPAPPPSESGILPPYEGENVNVDGYRLE